MHMQKMSTTVSLEIDIALAPLETFEVFIAELTSALAQIGMGMTAGAQGGMHEGGFEVGRVMAWVPGEHLKLQWQQASWQMETTTIEIHFTATVEGTHVRVVHQGWGTLLDTPQELSGWFASALVAPFLRTCGPQGLGDWLTDRQARRPSGEQARQTYRDPLYHYPNFRVILQELALTPDDYVLEIGCGGGALLKEALASGCRAAGIDHSAAMVELAREANQAAVDAGMLTLQQSSAESLPFADGTFSCVMMTGVLGFLSDPVVVFKEMRRVLADGGRIVVLGSDPELRGTLAAPEPMASRLHFYEEDVLARLAEEAGLRDVQVVRRNLQPFARQVGVPEEHLGLFGGAGAQFLLARK